MKDTVKPSKAAKSALPQPASYPITRLDQAQALPEVDSGQAIDTEIQNFRDHDGRVMRVVMAEGVLLNRRFNMTTDASIEQEIQAKGLTSPRVTPADIEANIVTEAYFAAIDGALSDRGALFEANGGDPNVEFSAEALRLLTFCVLVLRNGFTVTGESACASPENFDAELGQKIARANAVNKIWPLMGYALKEQLFQRTQPTNNPD